MTLPASNITIKDGARGVGFASFDEFCAVIGCCEKGAVATPKVYRSPGALIDDYGYGPATEYGALHMSKTGKPIIFVRTTGAVAGSNLESDADSVTGTSAVTVSGTPLDSYDGIFVVTTGGTIGTAGIEFKYSLDDGKTYITGIALGTANSYAIPNTGLTLNFGAGTLVAADQFSWRSVEPMWNGAGLTAAFTALKAGSLLFRVAKIVGELDSLADLQAVGTEMSGWETAKRFAFAIGSLRHGPYRQVRMVGNPDLTYADADPDTITRSAGSWVDDGFKVGMTITQVGSASNDAQTFTVATVAATVLTLDAGDAVVAEVATSDVELTGVESDATYLTDLRSFADSYAPTNTRVAVGMGMGRFKSAVSSHRLRRPSSWLACIRFFERDIQKSLARVRSGPISYASILDDNGTPEEYDARLDGSAENARMIALRTFDTRGGVFIELPMMMHSAGSDFTRVHYRSVMDVVCEIVQATLELELSEDVPVNADGTIREDVAKTVEAAVNRRLNREVTTKERATAAWYTLNRDDDVASTNAVTGKAHVRPRGYLETITSEVSYVASES